MPNNDTDNIKKMTKEKIAYLNYEREENMKKNKMKHIVVLTIAIGLFACGTITANALTDNSIVDTVKDVLKLKVDDQEYNANCQKEENGDITCNIPDSVTNGNGESKITVSKEYIDKINAEMTTQDGESIVSITVTE